MLIQGGIGLIVKIMEGAGALLVKAQSALGADGQAIAGELLETINEIMWEGIAIVVVVELGDLGTIEPVQTIGGSDPEESLVVLGDVGDRIAAEALFGGQLFYKMRNWLRGNSSGKQQLEE